MLESPYTDLLANLKYCNGFLNWNEQLNYFC
jgi:hypothetical protein